MREHSVMGPSIWAVSDGRAGNAAQVRALMAALSESENWLKLAHIKSAAHRTDPVSLVPRLPWTLLPGAKWPLPRYALPAEQRQQLRAPWPDLWIAAGRRSAPYTAAVRKWSKGQTKTIQILDPKRDSADFDLVVVPEHDALDSPNTMRITGSPTHFFEADLEAAGHRFADLADHREKSVVVLLGGDSKAHRFTPKDADRLEHQLRQLAQQGWRLRLTTSRRTPIEIAAQFRSFANQVGAVFWSGPQDGENPFLAWLLYSQIAIVTEDSANMLSDVAWHGLPIHIAKLTGRAKKFDRFHQSLIDAGAARWFEGTLTQWTYPSLREADRVVDRLIEMLLEQHPRPEYAPEVSL